MSCMFNTCRILELYKWNHAICPFSSMLIFGFIYVVCTSESFIPLFLDSVPFQGVRCVYPGSVV